MTQITANGKTYSDDGTAAKDMNNGGFRDHLLPMLGDVMVEVEADKNAADAARIAAQAAAASAVNAPGTYANSTTSWAISTGSKTFYLAQLNKAFALGQYVMIAASADARNWMSGVVMAHNPATGKLDVFVTNYNVQNMAGLVADWVISVSGAPGVTGVLNEFMSADIQAASNIDCTAMTGNHATIVGTASITSFTIKKGASRSFAVQNGLTLVHGTSGTPIQCPTLAPITLVPGDMFTIRAYADNQCYIASVSKIDGTPVKTTIGCQVFSASGNFTVPAGCTTVYVECFGGGGGGGAGYSQSGSGAYTGGGGGGARGVQTFYAGEIGGVGAVIPVTVGAGGLGAATAAAAGAAGGYSSFGNYCFAYGGAGGQMNTSGGGGGIGSNAVNAQGGAPAATGYRDPFGGGNGASWDGSAASTPGYSTYGGAGAGCGNTGGSSFYGGGGGGGTGQYGQAFAGGRSGTYLQGGGAAAGAVVSATGANGGNGANGASFGVAGGAGGHSYGATSGRAGNGGNGGVAAGGGAGGSSNSTNTDYFGRGGNGGRGEVRVYYW